MRTSRIASVLKYLAITLVSLYLYMDLWSSNLRLMGDESFYSLFNISQVVMFVTIGILVVTIFLEWKKLLLVGRAKWVLLLLSISIFVVVASMSMRTVLAILVGVLLITMANKNIMKCILFSNVPLFILTVVFGLTGVLTGGDGENTAVLAGADKLVELSALGFPHTNSVIMAFIYIFASLAYLVSDSPRWRWSLLPMFLFSVWLGFITGSSGGVIAVGIIGVILLLKRTKTVQYAAKKILPYAFIFGAVLTFVISLGYGAVKTLPNDVNDRLTGRPALWALRIENHSYLNLYGNNDEYNVTKYMNGEIAYDRAYPLDNGPLYMMVHFGLPVFLLYALLFYRAGKLINDPKLIAIGVGVLVAMMNEQMVYNIYIIFAIKYVYGYYLTGKVLE